MTENCVIVAPNIAAQTTTFSITDTKISVTVEPLSTQDSAKLFKQLKSCFIRTIDWNKYQTKVSTERINQYLDFLFDPSFQGINRIFVLPLEKEEHRTIYKRYYLRTKEIENYNVTTDEQNFFSEPIRINLITFEKLQQGKEMITQLVVGWTIIVPKTN